MLRYTVPRKSSLTGEQVDAIRNANASNVPIRQIARDVGTSTGTVLRTLARIVDRNRKADEFKPALASGVKAPRRDVGTYSWSLEQIRGAMNAQAIGSFRIPVAMAKRMRTDDALFVARRNRIAPQSSIAATLTGDGSARSKPVLRKAQASCFVARSTLAGIQGTLADHGIAIGFIEHEPSDDGTRVDFRLTEWPLEHVTWNASREVLETATKDGTRADIVHGDGKWVVFRKFLIDPWAQEACILPGALVWAAHANGIRDWALASTSHGQAKIMGELPAGIALRGSDGVALSSEAEAFLEMLQGIVSGEMGAGVRPAGSKTEFLANGSTAWQVFSELIVNREKAAARIYLGTDAILGSMGGAPGVDISALFGVATTIIQGDLGCIEQALRTGFYEPWTAVNFGDSTYAPSLVYALPDPDEAQKSQQHADKLSRLTEIVAALRSQKFEITQDVVNTHAAALGIKHPPALAVVVTPPPAPTPTPTKLSTLAGPHDESKHPRADDGKFGTGPGSSGGGAKDRPKGDSDTADDEDEPADPKERAQARVEQEHDRLAATVARRDAVAEETRAAESEYQEGAKAFRGELSERSSHANAKASEAHAMAADAKAKAADARAAGDEDEAENLDSYASDLTKSARRAKASEKLAAEAESAAAAGDTKRAERAYDKIRKIDSDTADEIAAYETRESASAAWDQVQRGELTRQDYFKQTAAARGAAAQKHAYPGAEGNDLEAMQESRERVAKSRDKLQKFDRRVRVRERELARAQQKLKDADGDGRTGDAEEKDDEKEREA